MSVAELGAILKGMYNSVPMEDAGSMIRLFGIKYAAEIQKDNYSVEDIMKASGISKVYLNELSKGLKLSEYVTPRQL